MTSERVRDVQEDSTGSTGKTRSGYTLEHGCPNTSAPRRGMFADSFKCSKLDGEAVLPADGSGVCS